MPDLDWFEIRLRAYADENPQVNLTSIAAISRLARYLWARQPDMMPLIQVPPVWGTDEYWTQQQRLADEYIAQQASEAFDQRRENQARRS